MTHSVLPYRFWTRADEYHLEEMRLEGQSHAEMARALGRTPQAVNTRCSKLHICRPRIRTGRWLDLFLRGLTHREAARQMGCTLGSSKTIKSRLRRQGLLGRAPARPGGRMAR